MQVPTDWAMAWTVYPMRWVGMGMREWEGEREVGDNGGGEATWPACTRLVGVKGKGCVNALLPIRTHPYLSSWAWVVNVCLGYRGLAFSAAKKGPSCMCVDRTDPSGRLAGHQCAMGPF